MRGRENECERQRTSVRENECVRENESECIRGKRSERETASVI